MKKLQLRETGAKRTDSFLMNPQDIEIVWSENPREYYGDSEFTDLKEGIRSAGEVIFPVMVKPNTSNDGWKLAHGFRRLKAVLELMNEGFVIEQVKVIPVHNDEDVLINHIILNNTTKALTDIELSGTLRQLQKLTQIDNLQELSRRTGLNYNKVRLLLGFAEVAGTVLRDAVRKDEISFSAAAEIAQNSNGIDEQMQILDAAKKGAESEGKKKVSSTNVSKALGKVDKISKDLRKLRSLLIIAKGFENVVEAIDSIALDNHEIISILKK